MDNIINIVKHTIDKYNMLEEEDKVVVAVSGGADSVCLLHVLYQLKNEYNIKLYVAHVNHGLRGYYANSDAIFVEQLSNNFNIPVFVKKIDVKHISKQQSISEEVAGRNERYKYFFDTAKKVGANKIAVAQNINDQGETVLMRLIRGTGLEGLGGIKPVRADGVIRPLLEVDRTLIEQYCKENSLNPRLDATNLEPIYTRNKIRLNLIPDIIKNYNPNLISTISKTADLIREENEFIESYVENIAKSNFKIDSNGIYINKEFLLKQHKAIQRRLIRKVIYELRGNIIDIEYKHVQKIIKMVIDNFYIENSKAALELPQSLKAKMQDKHLYIFNNRLPKEIPKKICYHLPIDKKVIIKGINDNNNSSDNHNIEVKAYVIDKLKLKNIKTCNFIKVFDYDIIKEDIYIRNRLPGDKFMPSGMNGTKKLKDFFIDLKIPKEKRHLVLLVTTKTQILWVVGYRTNEKYKCTNKTNKILVIEFSGGGILSDR